MIWNEVYINKNVSKRNLSKAISEAFHVKEEDILITSNLSKFLGQDIKQKIICETSKMNSEVLIKLEFNIDDGLKPQNDIMVYSTLMKMLKCDIIIDNYSLEPDSMIKLQETTFDEDYFDNLEEWELQ